MSSKPEPHDVWYCRHADHIAVNIDDDSAVVLQTATGVYYELTPVSHRIWELVASPTAFGELCDTLVEEYGIGRTQCEADVAHFLRQLVDAELASVVPAPDVASSDTR